MKQPYQRTWCDYLTPCKVNPDIMVGEYDCEQCKHFQSRKEEKGKEFEPCDYSRYSYVWNGEVECKADEMEPETNYVLDSLKQINSLLSGRQKECHDILIKHAKVVHCSPLSEVLTPEQIERVKKVVDPQAKECFKNAQNVVRYISGTEYVEGQWGLAGVIGVEHAFNKIGDKYFDVTAELALGKDVTKESYVSILEVTNGYDILSAQVDLECYAALIPYFADRGKYLV